MARQWMQLATFCLGALALLCWVVMFLSGTDVWHDLGRPDLWHLQGPPYTTCVPSLTRSTYSWPSS